MPRMPKRRKAELCLFLTDKGRVRYNELCRRCQNQCKQSFRVKVIQCPNYHSKRAVPRPPEE